MEELLAIVESGADQLGSSSAEKDLGVMVEGMLNVSQCCALPAMRADSFPGAIERTTDNKLSTGVTLLYLMLVKPHMEYCVWFLGKKKRKNIQERCQ